MTIELQIWMIPALVTALSVVAAFLFVKEDKSGGFLSGIGAVFNLGINLIVALVISLLSWIVFAIYVLV